jgi:hypothetical protein
LSDTGTRESVRRTLSQAARRLRAQRLLAGLGPALCAGLAGPAVALLLPAGPGRIALAFATPFGATAWLWWRARRPLPAQQTAAWLDHRAGLADALTTACWFLDREPDDAWARHQRQLAVEATRDLDLRRLVPLRVAPGPLLLAAALASIAVLGWRGEAPLRRSGVTGPAGEGAAPAPERERGEPRAEPDAEAGRDSLPDLPPAPADLAALAEELRAALGEEAREKLRELARRAEALRPPEADAAASGGGRAEDASGQGADAEELAAALAQAAAAVERGDAEAAARVLEDAAEAAQDAARQRPQQPPEPGAPGQRQATAADEAPPPADAGVRWALDALDPQGLEAGDAQRAARGDAAGPPSGGEPEQGEATELDVELEREALQSESARETEPGEITEEASREQGARVGYRGGASRGGYAAALPLEPTEVSWPARERVRRYLLALTQEEPQR